MFTLGLIGLVGGLITGISPCILPVLPVIFLSGGAQAARTEAAAAPVDRGRQRRPYLVVAGLALSFSVFTLLGTLVLNALPVPEDVIRWLGLVVLVLLGIGMILPRFGELLERPFSRIPQRSVDNDGSGFVLGLALGAVYVPCAGPVLAAITVAGATGRIGLSTVVLTAAFAIGTSIPLLVFALAGRRVAERVRAFRQHQRRIRVLAGVVVIALAVALTFNVTDAIQRAIPDYTASLNKVAHEGAGVARALGSGQQTAALAECSQAPSEVLQDCGPMPAITGIARWLNTPGDDALTTGALKGKVILVDFWAYSCINCQRAIPHDEAWYRTYKAAGLEVVGVHTPEYAFEHVASNVASGAKRLGITYPVALDNDYTTWNDFGNDSWPAEYLIDSTGQVRHVGIGEGDYDGTESLIRKLLAKAHPGARLPSRTQVADTTPQSYVQTPETYLGTQRAERFVSPGGLRSGTHSYRVPASIKRDRWALAGTWSGGGEFLTSGQGASITLSFDASDVYLDVGGTGTITATVGGRTKTYQVSGAPDIYTVAHSASEKSGVLKVTLSPGLQAYSFTFG
jgi:cytochrome c biogenesis protein CcdA/thiol-disulfide isomerase/thioredoxin